MFVKAIPPSIAELLWKAVVVMVKISQLTVFDCCVETAVHTGAFLTGFYCHVVHQLITAPNCC